MSQAAYDSGIKEKLGLEKQVLPVHCTRTITKKDMKLNDLTPEIFVDPETYEVRADGVKLTSEPAERLPLTQMYSLF